MRTVLTSALCLLVLQTGCSQDLKWSAVNRMIAADYPGVPTLTTDSLAARLADSTASRPLLLDARSAEEYAVSHLPGARRVDPEADALPPDLDTVSRSRPIVVYCSVGYRSARVTTKLRDQGFTDVRNLDGSIFRWANEGRPIVRGDTPADGVHPYDQTWGTLLNDSLHRWTPPDSTL
ncbi:MAG: rhodanese-like domain-containing protein [Salinibacter sp.]